jgi:hypothetical protein
MFLRPPENTDAAKRLYGSRLRTLPSRRSTLMPGGRERAVAARAGHGS